MSDLAYGHVVTRLLQGAPGLALTLDAHLESNGEILPHVFFGDVTRYVEARVNCGDTETVKQILAVFEDAVSSSDAQARDLIGASFLENLETDALLFSTLAELAGPQIKVAIEGERNHRNWGPEA